MEGTGTNENTKTGGDLLLSSKFFRRRRRIGRNRLFQVIPRLDGLTKETEDTGFLLRLGIEFEGQAGLALQLKLEPNAYNPY